MGCLVTLCLFSSPSGFFPLSFLESLSFPTLIIHSLPRQASLGPDWSGKSAPSNGKLFILNQSKPVKRWIFPRCHGLSSSSLCVGTMVSKRLSASHVKGRSRENHDWKKGGKHIGQFKISFKVETDREHSSGAWIIPDRRRVTRGLQPRAVRFGSVEGRRRLTSARSG